MPTDHREQLRQIRSFPSLVKYLRDELDWPVESDSFDDLVFDYEPEELGIDAKTAAKIESIKQLRPLTGNQPWGIFFVKFEPKRLPVVALRRILGQLVFRKRASANKAERPAWNLHDLLFISAFGEGDDRQISLAHFSEDSQLGNLATLKVLGWDGDDTGLHLDHVHQELHDKLRWPADEEDVAAWRDGWSAAFTLRHREVITTAHDLAIALADLARKIRKKINAALSVETQKGKLRKLMKAFQESLIHDLDEDDFADMYAQTIAYGLLSASISRASGALVADDLALMASKTSPFLRELLETFLNLGGRRRTANGDALDFDELGINDVVDMLRAANMEAVLRNFGDEKPEEDPVIHFYELFLKEYDAKKRMQRGVFYTPKPVVSYIVRSVHELLQTEFGLVDGLADTTTWCEMAARAATPPVDAASSRVSEPTTALADETTSTEAMRQDAASTFVIPEGVSPDDPFVCILDPATGTATFLVEVIDVIHRTLVKKWRREGHGEKKIETLWNDYVPKHLLPRLHGYELLMAPYAIAHMKIGLKLAETGYRFGSDERARVYLTNALEPPPPRDRQMTFADWCPALAHEAQAVNAVKRNQCFTVVVGNPPYSGVSVNMSEHAQGLVDRYRSICGKRLEEVKLWLQNDYVKFTAFAQECLERSDAGVWGFITDNSYLDGPTFRGMRHNLAETFSPFGILDLHGSSKRRDRTDTGEADENVFDITQGVCIALAARHPRRRSCKPAYGDITGTREAKYALLLNGTFTFEALTWAPPFFLLVSSDHSLREEYDLGISVTDAFSAKGNGFMTGRDAFVIAFVRTELEARLRDFFDLKISDAALRERYGISDYRAFRIAEVRRALKFQASRIVEASYRPFDIRWTYFQRPIIQEWQISVHEHMFCRENRALCVGRAGNVVGGGWDICFCTKTVTDLNQFYRGGNVSLPIYRYPEAGEFFSERTPNFTRRFVEALSQTLNIGLGETGVPQGLTPEDIFHYTYGVLHSPGYRSRYAEFLKIDFPRLPLTGSLDLFRALARLGDELVALHLMESPTLDRFNTSYIGPKNPEVGRVAWCDNGVWIDAPSCGRGANQRPGTIGFKGVPEAVWNFHIGGYQVCQKWLKDRKGRTLSEEDIAHYQKIVVALNETIRIMGEIDDVIDQHGGWPGAFVTASDEMGDNA